MRYDAELVFESYSSRDMWPIDTHFLSFKAWSTYCFIKKLYGKQSAIHWEKRSCDKLITNVLRLINFSGTVANSNSYHLDWC